MRIECNVSFLGISVYLFFILLCWLVDFGHCESTTITSYIRKSGVVTSHLYEHVRSGHNIELLSNAVDKNNSFFFHLVIITRHLSHILVNNVLFCVSFSKAPC